MRFSILLSVVFFFSAFQLSMAQSQPEQSLRMSEEVNLAKSVHLFPNPASEYVNVKLDHLLAENVEIAVYNIIGNELQVKTAILEEKNVIEVTIKDLASGYYLLAVKDEESNFRGTYKFLKR